MVSLMAILKKLWGLFVDDGNLALALVIWVAACAIGLAQTPIPLDWDAPVFFVGCLAILTVNVMQTVKRKRAIRADG